MIKRKELFLKNILFVFLFLFILIGAGYAEAGEKIEDVNPPADCGANWTEDINECKGCHNQNLKMSNVSFLNSNLAIDECGGNDPYKGLMQTETTSDGKLMVTHPDTTVAVGTNLCFENSLKINGLVIAYYYYVDDVVTHEEWWPSADPAHSNRYFYPESGIHTYKVHVIYCSNGTQSCFGWRRLTKEWTVKIEKKEEPELIKIPLGKEVTITDNDKIYRIYIPGSSGGIFTVETNSGIIELYYPDISTKIAGPNTGITYSILFEDADGNPIDNHGWYYVKHSGAVPSIISNTFKEEGEANYRPWNFWYYPFKRQDNPAQNLYGESGALAKYDVSFGTMAREYEEKNFSNGLDWAGHCWGGVIASILLPQPQDTVYHLLSEEEMEGLVSKLANTDLLDEEVEVIVNGIPSIKPQPGTDGTDKFADEFHIGLQKYLRIEKDKKPIQSNIRDPQGIDPEAVWNHAIYKYTSNMEESEEGKENIIKITTTIYANEDIFPSDDNTKNRVETYVYKLKYKSRGIIDDYFPGQDWIGATGFAPKSLRFIKGCHFDGLLKYNPYVTKENVEKLGIDFLKIK